MAFHRKTLTQGTLDEEDDNNKKKKASKKSSGEKSTAQSAGEGATQGAALGSIIPGVGTLIGAGVGAAAGAADANKAKKDAASAGPRPKRRRMTAAANRVQARRDKRRMALATLAQATMDWASRIG